MQQMPEVDAGQRVSKTRAAVRGEEIEMGYRIPVEEEIGKRFGQLVVLRHYGYKNEGGSRIPLFECSCDCGRLCIKRIYVLRKGDSKSCGCLHLEAIKAVKTTHGDSGSTEFKTWAGMIKRCSNAKSKDWDRYGGRGISVCERWVKSYDNFLKDMGRRPSARHSIDRIDVDGGYGPGNCRWADPFEQANNASTNRKFTLNGETLGLCQWARKIGMSIAGLKNRIDRSKWPIEKALTHPVAR